MSAYRRFIRAKKGMSTIFGGLFFIILILMGFNVMLWGFIQYDKYNGIITTMAQRDQQATAENLIPVNPGATDFNIPGQSFNITVNNLGIAVSIARIYILNIILPLAGHAPSHGTALPDQHWTPYRVLRLQIIQLHNGVTDSVADGLGCTYRDGHSILGQGDERCD